jgi:hypothetical protein
MGSKSPSLASLSLLASPPTYSLPHAGMCWGLTASLAWPAAAGDPTELVG